MKKKSALKGLTLMTVGALFSSLLAGPTAFGDPIVWSESKAGLEQTAAHTGPMSSVEVEQFADDFFNRPEIKKKLVGAAFTIVADNKVLLNKGYGYSDLETKTFVDPEQTIFRMASISKVMTATAVMQLVEQGKINLDEDIEKYLGGMTITNHTGTPVTMRHLLTHTSGFDFTDYISSNNGNHVQSLTEFIEANLPTVIRTPGESYRYDNFAFNLQGYIIQRMVGYPFEEYIQKHIFEPLNMKNSDFLMSAQVKKQLATGYGTNGQPKEQYPNDPVIMPDGGMFGTSGDIAQFMLAHLNEGSYGSSQILSKTTIEEMHRTQVEVQEQVPTMALGFEKFYRHAYHGQMVIGKGGDLPGYHSWMWLIPEHKIGGFVITNSDASQDIGEELFTAFMDHYYPQEKQKAKDWPLHSNELDQYTGTYRYLRQPYLFFDIVKQKGELSISGPNGTHTLKPVGDQLFVDEEGNQAVFKKNSDGKITYLDYILPDSWFGKIPDLPQYSDVANDDYAGAIYRSTKLFMSQHNEKRSTHYYPDEAITRGEFASQLIQFANLRPSDKPVVFKDAEGHKYASAIQTLADLGILVGTSTEMFDPDRKISRQEAATILWRLSSSVDLPIISAEIADQPAPWAVDAVKFLVGAGIYGPDVTKNEEGIVNYRSQEPLLRKESAVIWDCFSRILTSGL
ncbi:serine hydrolase [Paenibacillus xylanilyticus]|uniref:serine hydrolase n=1 Tax=Paenibacillus xylanilyticus TaxID=248903 RepID=UPI0039A06F24